jgi:hypothetical protein
MEPGVEKIESESPAGATQKGERMSETNLREKTNNTNAYKHRKDADEIRLEKGRGRATTLGIKHS